MDKNSIGVVVGGIAAVLIFIVSLMFGIPVYKVWQQGLAGEASLKRAVQERQILITKAKSEQEAAKYQAKAIEIVGEMAQKYPEYRKQEFIGAFADAMEHLESTGMKGAVLEFALSGKPMIGICLGMQLLFESSEEFGLNKGLGLIPGKVVAFDKSKMNMDDHKVPHIGWNKLFHKDNKLFKNLYINPFGKYSNPAGTLPGKSEYMGVFSIFFLKNSAINV